MSDIKIYGHPISPNVNVATSVAKYLKVEYEFVLIDIFAGKNKEEAYLSKQPNGLVPLLEDGDFRLGESASIAKYLCEVAGSDIYPKEVNSRATVDMHIGILNDLRTALSKVVSLLVIGP